MKLVRSAKVVILDNQDRALMLYRSETHPRLPLHPDLPGGIIESDETTEDGLVREISEETGLVIERSDLTLLYTFTHELPAVSVNRFLYGARLAQDAPLVTMSYEHGKYEWVEIAELEDIEAPYQDGIDYANKHQLWTTL